ncbi:MAG TPA: hypothetical protein VG408_02770, partial [Actinomycetota bacterium]|nr:hypothetical protein [Actinomycetota bacterium]
TAAALALLFAAQFVATSEPARAGVRPDEISDNLTVVADGTQAILCSGGKFTNHGGDISFVDDKAIVLCGSDDEGIENDGFVVADISDPSTPTEIGRFECVASASDLAVWEDLVFLAVDRNGDSRGAHIGPYDPDDDGDPATPDPLTDDCSAPVASYYDATKKKEDIFRGIRIVSIADPDRPQLVASIPLGARGAHTVSVLPRGSRPAHGAAPIDEVYLYASSPTDRENWVLGVPLDDPAAAAGNVTTIDHGETWGCHDISFFVPAGLAACAAVGAARGDPAKPTEAHFERPIAGASLLDIRDDADDPNDDGAGPTSPKLVAVIDNPHPAARLHSAAFSWDGKTLIFSDENNTSTQAGFSCLPEETGGLSGGLWFYDISDSARPKLVGYQEPHYLPGAGWCTSVNFNVIPLGSGRDVLVGAWYMGGTTVVDFSDPSDPREIAYFNAAPGDPEVGSLTRAAYWYDGLIYINNVHGCLTGIVCLGPTARGLDVLRLNDSGLDLSNAVGLGRFDMGLQECVPPLFGRDPDSWQCAAG